MQNNDQGARRAPANANASPYERRRSANTGTTRRPSGFSAPSARRPTAPTTQPTRPAQKRPAQIRNKRARNAHRSEQRKLLLPIAGAALLAAVLAVLISAAVRGSYHQLPRVTRSQDQTPEPTATASLETPSPFDGAFAGDPSATDAADPSGAEAA